MTGADLLQSIAATLDAAGIPFMLTGSMASAYHGAGRATMDIDLVIDPTRTQLLAVAKLEWARLGGSARQIEDVAALLTVHADELDRAYLDRWIAELGLVAQLQQALPLRGTQ